MPVVLSAVFAALIECVFVAFGDAGVFHWFLLPLLLCGTLSGLEVLLLLRGQLDFRTPKAMTSLFLYHGLFLAPLFHAALPYSSPPIAFVGDLREYMGWMACLNAIGLIIYRFIVAGLPPVFRSVQTNVLSSLDRRRVKWILVPAMMLAVLTQIWIYARYGGISGFTNAYSNRFVTEENPFEDMGRVFMIASAFPFLFAVFVIQLFRGPIIRSTAFFVLFAAVEFAFCLFFGGLRGSRSETVYSMFIIIGVYSVAVRPLKPKELAIGAFGLFIFMWGYSYYKSLGAEGVAAYYSGGYYDDEALEQSGRGWQRTLLHDLARADVQAFVLKSVVNETAPLAWGSSYVGAAARLVPSALLPDRPATKIKVGSLFVLGTYSPGIRQTSLVFGSAGEAMMNFGVIGVFISFAFVGGAVRLVTFVANRLHPNDLRRTLIPLFSLACATMLVSDSDNTLYFLSVKAVVPTLVIILLLKRKSLRLRRRWGQRLMVPQYDQAELVPANPTVLGEFCARGRRVCRLN